MVSPVCGHDMVYNDTKVNMSRFSVFWEEILGYVWDLFFRNSFCFSFLRIIYIFCKTYFNYFSCFYLFSRNPFIKKEREKL